MGWIRIAVLALAISGLYSIILVMLRAPYISSYLPAAQLFKSSLIIHVNMSVLIWFLTILCFIWEWHSTKYIYNRYYLLLTLIAIILMALSPLAIDSEAIMNNYVPILENLSFVLGLSLFLSVIFCFSIQTVIRNVIAKNQLPRTHILPIVQLTTSILYIVACICFVLSYNDLTILSEIVPLDLEYYYEMIFWSGGHILQFVYTQIYMLVLFVLVENKIGKKLRNTRIYEMLFWLNFICGLIGLIGHWRYEIADAEFKIFYTQHMIYLGGLVPTLFILGLLIESFCSKSDSKHGIAGVAFFCSIFMFLFGGSIGVVISGVNVTIPAHYHGSIVGISIAFMGLIYLLLFDKKDGQTQATINLYACFKGDASLSKQKAQLYIITIGQFIHILGLALAGGYGVMRKSPGDQIALSAKIYMGLVGIGGLVAIIGGLMFVAICAKSLYSRNIFIKE